NAAVQYSVLPLGPVDTASNEGCIIDLGKLCTTRTNAQGVAVSHPLKAVRASTQPATIRLATESEIATAELFVDPVVPPMRLTVASGANQSTPVGTSFPNPFV